MHYLLALLVMLLIAYGEASLAVALFTFIANRRRAVRILASSAVALVLSFAIIAIRSNELASWPMAIAVSSFTTPVIGLVASIVWLSIRLLQQQSVGQPLGLFLLSGVALCLTTAAMLTILL